MESSTSQSVKENKRWMWIFGSLVVFNVLVFVMNFVVGSMGFAIFNLFAVVADSTFLTIVIVQQRRLKVADDE